jgi:hypothetical protein
MDGFKNSTRVQYMKGGPKHEAKGAAKIAKVMGEFKAGTLHSGSKKGPEVTNKKQAVAIAMSEARKAGAKMPVKRNRGTEMGKGPESGSAEAGDVFMARMTKDELAQGAKGVRMAKERMEKQRVTMPAKKLPPKAVPVAAREPLVSPATMRDIKMRAMIEKGAAGGLGAVSDSEMKMLRNAGGYKKGGLSAMPKSKGGKC